MSCTCQELEDRFQDEGCKCKQYREHFPDCQCESESVSPHSPGIVTGDEVLVRTLFNEKHLGPDKVPTPLYFRNTIRDRGFSVDRIRQADENQLLSQKKLSPQYSGYLRFVTASCGDVRELMHEDGRRLFCVYDSAQPNNSAHADICRNVYVEANVPDRKKKMMSVAENLRSIFRNSISLPSVD